MDEFYGILDILRVGILVGEILLIVVFEEGLIEEGFVVG